MKETIVITGSSGFVGEALAVRLSKHYNVVGLDRFPPGRSSGSVEFLDVDFSNQDSVQAAFRHVRKKYGERLASVAHLAAYYDFSNHPHADYEEVTVRGTRRVLRELRNFKAEQFIFASTMFVHAPCEPGQTINENWPLYPKWEYPLSKFRAEEVIRAKHGSTPYVLMRIAEVYDRHCHSVPISRHMQRIYERKALRGFFPGHISHGQAYLHIDDLISAMESAVDRRHDLPPELEVLLGEPDTLSYDELQHRLARLIHGEKLYTHQVPKSIARLVARILQFFPFARKSFFEPWMIEIADDHYEVDIAKADAFLDWEPQNSLRQMLPDMVGAFKTDLRGWYRKNKLLMPPAILKRSGQERRVRIGSPPPGKPDQRRNRDRRFDNPGSEGKEFEV